MEAMTSLNHRGPGTKNNVSKTVEQKKPTYN